MGAYLSHVDPQAGLDYRPRIADAELAARLAATGAVLIEGPAAVARRKQRGRRPRARSASTSMTKRARQVSSRPHCSSKVTGHD
jgi:hypothetical protein